MTITATCTPGQSLGSLHLVALAGGMITLQPESGSFGDDLGYIMLVDSALPRAEYEMSVACVEHLCPAWSSDLVVANLPISISAPILLDRLFTVRVKTADQRVFEATDVAIVGPPGTGYPTQPPMHREQATMYGTLSEGPLAPPRGWVPAARHLGSTPPRRTVVGTGRPA